MQRSKFSSYFIGQSSRVYMYGYISRGECVRALWHLHCT